ncbi:glycosyltransferase [Natronoglomus mannanivorans]|uniref:Glycosyltransferase n=1 Tax=Natronoglomus mannanivorans TaxID=2979990 RepID=A0AAP2Z034_9EURY|nr:glycosyltransferase [Halobacteria archaeon AArc-xg1-1]
MKILNLVTTPRPFFEAQINILEKKGVETTTLQVPGRDNQGERRSYIDHFRFYPHVLRKSLEKYDIVHANFGLTGPHALAQPRRPVVLSLWGSDLMGRYNSVVKQCANHADQVIVRSEEMKEELERDAHVIPAGVDFDLFRPMDQKIALEKVGWNPDHKHVLFPYNPSRSVKNYPLASSVVEIVDGHLDVPVNLKVVFGMDHKEIPNYLNAADVLLLTSDREGSPNTVKEAMACNTPIVSTDVGDIHDLTYGVSGCEVCQSKNDLIDSLYSTLTSRKKPNGRGAIQELSLEKMGDHIIAVYQEALE